ncbi:MAG: SDR family NAD(P)-dependent oxidoreductase [Henriciella sp.]|nr:SDR family NAD(P)-dependent oxidoreductase [Henriciella sp.]
MSEASGRKAIFITGAASGIGAETARLFSRKGWFCGLYDIDDMGLKTIEAELGPDNCHTAHLDVTRREDWAAATARKSIFRPGMGSGGPGSAGIWTNTPVLGPPLYAWPVECRNRGPKPRQVATDFTRRTALRIADSSASWAGFMSR